ncbi:MAG: metallophosphoesterase family protein [Deltaproteobacteria bacterium]|nr:metallophosphoesterase family protein [Deltaproteobacteria bacterium]
MKSRRIGLMADSHGNLKATKKAIEVLRKEGAESLIHLGDFFDSLQNDPLSSLISLLKDNGVFAVKGNNDHQIEKLLKDNSYEVGAGREGVLSFIEDLPMIMVMKDLCFAHSLPFDALRSFYEPIDIGSAKRARGIFKNTSYRIVFAGHSHIPVFFRWKEGHATRETIMPGHTLSIEKGERYIMIVGAVYGGECALYDRDSMEYKRIRIM